VGRGRIELPTVKVSFETFDFEKKEGAMPVKHAL
jgi:hypothetical protein